MKLRIIVLFLFVSFFCKESFSQKDYAILKADTLYGKITNGLFGGAYLEIIDSLQKKLKPEEVSLYYRAKKDETYLSKFIPGQEKPVFMRRFINGKINLYTYTVHYGSGSTSSTVTTWYADKNNSDFGEIKTTGLRGGKDDRKEFFRSLIADNDEVVKKFDSSKKFSFDMIEEFIKEYNK